MFNIKTHNLIKVGKRFNAPVQEECPQISRPFYRSQRKRGGYKYVGITAVIALQFIDRYPRGAIYADNSMTELRPRIFASGLPCLQFNMGVADLRSNFDTVGSIEILSYGTVFFTQIWPY